MIYVISDLHGYPFERFTELLKKAGFSENDFLYVLGDVVDRGKEGVRYLLWLKEQKNAGLLLGNHEDMMRKCDFLFSPDALELMRKLDNNQRVNLGIWMANGADDTVRGLFEVSQEEREEIFRYLCTLAPYRTVSAGGREFVLTHSGLRDFAPQSPLTTTLCTTSSGTAPSFPTVILMTKPQCSVTRLPSSTARSTRAKSSRPTRGSILTQAQATAIRPSCCALTIWSCFHNYRSTYIVT